MPLSLPASILRLAAAGLTAATLAGCAAAPQSSDLTRDPFEAQNRRVHGFNKGVDRAVFRPVALAWGETVPAPVRRGVDNVRNNWRLPGHAAQSVLQGRPAQFLETVTRFAVNTTMGLGGLIDPAAEMGLPYRQTGFDETFFVWGIPEGGYLEVPLGGPGTVRDWTGWTLDLVLDPVNQVLPRDATNTLAGLGAADLLTNRYELDPVLDELLYTSADSYTAQRLSYLQNKRARLQGGTSVEQLEDVYADF